jgi:hypothetical protein
MMTRLRLQIAAGCHRSIARMFRGSILLTIVLAGVMMPSGAGAEGCGLVLNAGMSSSQRSIVQEEAQDPANFQEAPAWFEASASMSAGQRSIVLMEARDPSNFPSQSETADWNELQASMSPIQHSIVLLEAQDPANFPAQRNGC